MCTKKSVGFVAACMGKRAWPGPVIELGAGSESKKYKEYFNGKQYVTLDLAARTDCQIDIVADILNMPQVESDTYGVVLLCEVLEHLRNPLQAFKEAARILRPRGLFICTTVAAWPLHKHPFDFFRFLPDGLTHLCNTAGLKVVYGFFQSITSECGQACCVAAIKL